MENYRTYVKTMKTMLSAVPSMVVSQSYHVDEYGYSVYTIVVSSEFFVSSKLKDDVEDMIQAAIDITMPYVGTSVCTKASIEILRTTPDDLIDEPYLMAYTEFKHEPYPHIEVTTQCVDTGRTFTEKYSIVHCI